MRRSLYKFFLTQPKKKTLEEARPSSFSPQKSSAEDYNLVFIMSHRVEDLGCLSVFQNFGGGRQHLPVC